MTGLAFVTALALWAGPPSEQPARALHGTGSLAFGGGLQVLGVGAGVTGIALGGSPGTMVTLLSTVPLAAGGGVTITGAFLRGRYQAWYDPRDLLTRARTARRVGLSLMGVGLGLFIGNAVLIAVWPSGPCYDEGCAVFYPRTFAMAEAGFVAGQLMLHAGTSALTWSFAYSKAHGRRLELTPTLGGLSMKF